MSMLSGRSSRQQCLPRRLRGSQASKGFVPMGLAVRSLGAE
jgi:hypothetical protein